MNPLQSLDEYELFIYTLGQRYSSIYRSTLVVVRRGVTRAVLSGEVEMLQGIRLVVRERLTFADVPGAIQTYGYEIWRGDELLYWYDSQPHPNEASLASTHPHHKHVPPDIKHNASRPPA